MVVCASEFGGNNVGDCGVSDAVGFWVGADEAEPFLGDHESYEEDSGVVGDKQLAEVHHGVDVAASRVGHGHEVAATS